MHKLLLLCCVFYLSETLGQDLEFSSISIPDIPQGSRGVSIADLDGNGFNDIVIANQVDSLKLLGNTIYFNEGDRFRKEAIAAGKVQAWSESVHTVDVDNDKDLDLFFTTQFGVPNLLFLNNGKGNFSAKKAGDLTSDFTNSPGACWCDYDLDGDMDVFVVNRDSQDDALYVNNGEGFFTRATSGPWMGNAGDGRACAWGDLNEDGKPDLYVVNFVRKEQRKVVGKHRNYLYLSTPETSFVQQSEGALVQVENASYGVSLLDFDYDGDLDIYITNVSIRDINTLYRNDGNGHFVSEDQSAVSYQINRPSKGQSWGDYNKDGWLDLYVANGTEGYPEIQNYLFLGNENLSFQRIYTSLPATEGNVSAGTASGDLDNDGDLDLYVCNWGGEAEANDFYRNEHRGNQWLKLHLRGVQSNSYGIGSWVKLFLDNGRVQTRYFSRETGYGSENAPEVHFGFPSNNRIDKLEVRWPTGELQQFSEMEANSLYLLTEGQQPKRISK